MNFSNEDLALLKTDLGLYGVEGLLTPCALLKLIEDLETARISLSLLQDDTRKSPQ